MIVRGMLASMLLLGGIVRAAEPVKAASVGPSISWRIDDQLAHADFTVRALGVIPVHGRFVGLYGTVDPVPNGDGAAVLVTVPTARLVMRSRSRRDWALSDEFFDASNHPLIRFEAPIDLAGIQASLAAGKTPDIIGALTLRGHTLPQRFRLVGGDCRPQAAVPCSLDLEAAVSRKRFGMVSHSFTLSDTVSMRIALHLQPAIAEPVPTEPVPTEPVHQEPKLP